MESEGGAKFYLGRFLWGYPDLRKKFLDIVLPAWINEREKGSRVIEEKQLPETAAEHVDIDALPSGSEVVEQDQDNTSSTEATAPQSGQPASLHEAAEHLLSTQIEVPVISDSPGKPDDQPLPPDEHPPAASSRNTAEPEPMPRDPSSLADASVTGGGSSSPNEIEEVTSISENENQGSRLVRSEEEPGE